MPFPALPVLGPRAALLPLLFLMTGLSGACQPKSEKPTLADKKPAQPVEAEAKKSPKNAPEAAAQEGEPTEAERRAGVAPPTTPPTDAPRLYAKTRHVWIRSMPSSEVQWIGYLWWGGSVKLRDEKRVSGHGCSKEWVAVEPHGWVCADDKQATLDPKDPELLAIYPYQPQVQSAWPHKYALVHADLRRYDTLPDEALQKSWELGYEDHIAKVRAARKSGSIEAFPEILGKLDPSLSQKKPPTFPSIPEGLSEGQTRIVARSAMAYVTEADFGDRTFLLTSDLGWVPKDRVELYEPKEFQGVELGDKLKLPLAFFRGKARPAYILQGDGSFKEEPNKFARHSVIQLENEVKSEGRTKYYKVAGQDLWVSNRQAVIPTPRDTTPWGAPVGQADTTGGARAGRATWLEASILEGWLVAFEGTRAAYATMISAGRGGKPHPGKDPLETASTPTGRFPIGGKFKTATMMSSSTPIVHSDVPWTQNFSGPHAIHSAYWHDDWGNLKSAGCVNVAPRDGKWLFEFTEPDVPEGWHGVRYMARHGGGSTLLIIHE